MPEAIDVEQSARDLDALVADLHKCMYGLHGEMHAHQQTPVYPLIESSGMISQKPKDRAPYQSHLVYRPLLSQLVIQRDWDSIQMALRPTFLLGCPILITSTRPLLRVGKTDYPLVTGPCSPGSMLVTA
jgi:hypothetical protein